MGSWVYFHALVNSLRNSNLAIEVVLKLVWKWFWWTWVLIIILNNFYSQRKNIGTKSLFKLGKVPPSILLISRLRFWTSRRHILLIFCHFWVIQKAYFSSKSYQQITSKVPKIFHVEGTWWWRKITSHPVESLIFHM